MEPGGHPIEQVLQQIQLGIQGLRIGRGIAKENLGDQDNESDSREKNRNNGPESETAPKTAEALKKGADATRGRGQRKSRLYQGAGARN